LLHPQSTKKNRGWTILLVLFIVFFLMVMGFALMNRFGNEAKQAHNYVDAQVAHYLAESAINHTFYLLKTHGNDTNEPPYTNLPEKFATEDDFSFNVIPTWSITPKDKEIPILAVSIKQAMEKLVPNGTIESCDVEYKTVKTYEGESKLKSGILRVIAVGKYNNSRRMVVEEHMCHVYKDIPIEYDHVLYINNKEPEIIPGRRDKQFSGWKKFWNAISMNSKFKPQELYVNGKVFCRNLYVPLNTEKDSSLSGVFETQDAMLQKLSKKSVDKNLPPSKLGDISGLEDFFDINLKYKEADSSGLQNWLAGGSRGNIDLTGFDPAGQLKKFFTSLGFSDKKDRTPNKLVGDIYRVYNKKNTLLPTGDWERVVEPYITKSYGNNEDPIPQSHTDQQGYATANGYYYGKDSKLFNDKVEYPDDKVEGLFPENVYKDIAIKRRKKTQKVNYKIGKDTVTEDAVMYYGFGPWQSAPKSTGFFGPIKDFFKSKTGKEAAIANPTKYAIQLKGFEYIKGNAHIEGVYQGRGTIVATGNIYIGNEITRHPTDDSGKEFINIDGKAEYNDGAYNYLSLIALGSEPGINGEKTGKIIFRNAEHKDFIQPGFFKNLFKDKKDMKIQAFCYATNGIKAQFEDESWFGYGGENGVYTVFEGNYVGVNLDMGKYTNGNFVDEKGNWPDNMVLKEDPKWKVVLDELKANANQRVIVINPKIERYWQGSEF